MRKDIESKLSASESMEHDKLNLYPSKQYLPILTTSSIDRALVDCLWN